MARRGRGIVIDKNARLAKIDSPKIILVGGSNVCYGVNSKLLQDSLHMPVLDMAINADIGMLFYYKQVKPFIKKGDIVIGIPEYGAYMPSKLYGDVSMYQLGIVQKQNLKYISLSQWLRFPRYAGDLLKENYNVLTADINSDVSNGRKKYDSLGDYIGHRNDTSRLSNNKSFIPTFSEKNPFQIDRAFGKMIIEFNEYCKSKGATYIHSYPVFIRSNYLPQWQNDIQKQLTGVKFLNEPSEYLFNADSLYDSENHLQFRYRDIRTAKLIRNIKEALVTSNK